MQGVLRRQAEFDSAAAAFTRYRAAPAFADWSEASLWAYVRHGFDDAPDGRVRLLCRPEIEVGDAAADLRGDGAGLCRRRTRQSVRLVRPRSNARCALRPPKNRGPIYKEMAARAVALIPGASQWTFDGVGHCVAQEAPDMVIEALAAFES